MAKADFDVKFVHYEQSSACTSASDSSVSYAAALVFKR
jgi:predicted class III extradiol MEMO1 family dioxygenase